MQLPTVGLAILLACLSAQDTTRLQPVRHPTCVRFYSYEGDVKPELLKKQLDAVATKDAKARIAAGPSRVSSRPMSRFIVLEVPARTPAKDIESALKKICPHAEELAWTAFQGKSRTLPAIVGYPALDCVVGMDNDLRWFDLAEGRARFFFSPGKFDAKTLRIRFPPGRCDRRSGGGEARPGGCAECAAGRREALREPPRDAKVAAPVARREPRFRLDRELGSGATGRVLHGTLTEAFGPWPAGFEVAVKILHPHLASDPAALATFEAEARAGRAIEHPDVVHVLHAGTDARGPYLLMNFVPGRSLRDVLRETGPLPEPLVRSIARQIAGGLAALHAAGMVHGD